MSKGFSDAVKLKAMELWARGGLSTKDVSRALGEGGPGPGTITGWKARKVPQDWVLFRDDIQAKAREEAHRRILDYRAGVHLTHFEDWEIIRRHTMRSLSKPVKRDDKVVWVPREDLRPKDVRDAGNAYAAVQRGQRLALGIPSDYVIADELPHDGKQDRLAQELAMLGIGEDDLARLGDQLAEVISRVDDDDEGASKADIEDALTDDEGLDE